MYRITGEHVSRYPYFWIAAWVIFSVTAITMAPEWHEVAKDGEFTFLPEYKPSRQAELLFREAFPPLQRAEIADEKIGTSVQQDPLGSNVVIVLQRDPHGKTTLSEKDRSFISDVLVPRLEDIQRTTPLGYVLPDGRFSLPPDGHLVQPAEYHFKVLPEDQQVVKAISTAGDRRIGALLTSPNEKATLVILELRSEFLDRQNGVVVKRIENLVNDPQIQAAKPLGLSMALSGSATVGRDMLRAEQISASNTEKYTVVLVIVLLLAIYRAPLLALVPLLTVGISLELSKALLRIMAGFDWIGVFTGLDVYVTVVVYGAGIDYCLFLIARYKEELDAGLTHQQAMAKSIHKVGAALVTSAATCIVGIGMMGFSEFGKFRQAGFAISFGLFVVVCFALTFTAAFLLVFGKWVFWPRVQRETVRKSGWIPTASAWNKIEDQRLLERFWDWMAASIHRRPGTIFLATVLAMTPFAVIGVMYQDHVSYGLLTDLPQDEPSVVGAKVVQDHFPAGVTGPVTMFVQFDKNALQKHYDGKDLSDLRTSEKLTKAMTDVLTEYDKHRVEKGLEPVGIDDIRNQTYPLGMTDEAQAYLKTFRRIPEINARRNFAHKTYTSLHGDKAGEVLRMDFVLDEDPFSRSSIMKLDRLEEAVRAAIPLLDNPEATAEERLALRKSARVLPLGTTSGIRDLKTVTDRDKIVIDILVVISVYLVLVMLLRTPEICGYLMVTVVFSFLVTLGVTFVVFYLRDPAGFNGIDWKVPIFLFTILIAMGEDYNILLMARVTEEQEQRGYVDGVLHALTKTGSIISSCGIIMAGTFASLMTGTLLGMVQLGFALAFGVLLDTFVVRPILVPAYLMLLYSGRFGWMGRFLGAPRDLDKPAQLAPQGPTLHDIAEVDADFETKEAGRQAG